MSQVVGWWLGAGRWARNSHFFESFESFESFEPLLKGARLMEEDRFHRLTNVEAQRIMQVLEETVVNAHLVAMLGSYLEDTEALEDVAGPEVVELLVDHQSLEARYTDVWERKEATGRRGEKALHADLVDELGDVGEELVGSTRRVTRVLRANPDAVHRFRTHFASNRTPGLVAFIKTLNELRDLTLVRLQTTVEEEKSRQDKLASIVSRERQSTAEMEKLQGLLKKAVDVRNEEEKKRKRTIARLTKTLENLNSNTLEDMKSMEKDAKNRESVDNQHFAKAQAELEAEAAEKRSILAGLVEKNKAAEEERRRNRARIESEVVNWLNRYDDEMGEKQNELEDLQAVYAKEQGRLGNLQNRYAVLKREYDAILDEHARLQARAAAEAAEFDAMIRAATTIQAAWLGHKARKSFKIALKKFRKRKRRARARARAMRAEEKKRQQVVEKQQQQQQQRQRASASSGGRRGGRRGGSGGGARRVGASVVGTPSQKGVLVSAVAANSPAAGAGLVANDVVYRVGDVDLTSPSGFVQAVGAAGSGARLVVERDGQVLELTLP